MPVDKEFQSVYNQLRLLKSRGLQFISLEEAQNHLMTKGYFER